MQAAEPLEGGWYAVLYRVTVEDGSVYRIAENGPHPSLDVAIQAQGRHSVPPMAGYRWFHTTEFHEWYPSVGAPTGGG